MTHPNPDPDFAEHLIRILATQSPGSALAKFLAYHDALALACERLTVENNRMRAELTAQAGAS